MSYSISPVTKLFRENNIPHSPLIKSRGKSTGNYGNVVWVQNKDGYTWMKGQDSSVVFFEVRGIEVYEKIIEVLKENDVELRTASPNGEWGGHLSINLEQFNQ